MKWLLGILLLFISFSAQASHWDEERRTPENWNEFQSFIEKEEIENSRRGLAFMISGTLATLGGSVGYHESEEVLSRTIFALTSNIGLVAIGLGASYYFTGSEVDSFYYAINGSSLSLKQKNEVLQRYMQHQREEKDRRRWIRVATHSLIAVANFYSAAKEDNEQIRSVFYFLGGANTLMAISYSFQLLIGLQQ